MKSLLFALGFALCCFVQAEWKEADKTSIEALGRWMFFAVASNSSDSLEKLRNISAFTIVLSRPQENVLNVTAFLPMPDGCKNITSQITKGEDGKYHSRFDNRTVSVKSVKSLNNFIMTTAETGNYKTSILHSQTLTQDPEIIQKFKEECKKLGYSEAQIVVFNQNVKCP